MDAKKIIEKLKGEADRERTSLYLSRSTMEEFKEACGSMTPSKVMEELMKDFVTSSNNPRISDKKAEKEIVKALAILAESVGYEINKKN